MGTNRFFKFNSGTEIQNTLQVGNLSISDYPVTGYKWWPGPDEDLGYVITHEASNKRKGLQPGLSVVFFYKNKIEP